MTPAQGRHSETAGPNVAVVVVTHNREQHLANLLDALERQDHRIATLYLIDNNSTDGTSDLVKSRSTQHSFRICYRHVETNIGGAGGFALGMQLALNNPDHRWVWISDDDSIPAEDALSQLLGAYDRFPEERKPVVLASRVEWTDGTVHPRNLVTPMRLWLNHEMLYDAAAEACLALRATTFVSCLVKRETIEEYGLPHPGYFISMDDIEYTLRILKHEFGVLVPASRVVHATDRCDGLMESAPGRFYYFVRNSLWLMFRSRSMYFRENVALAVTCTCSFAGYVFKKRFAPAACWAVLRGVTRGIFTGPPSVPEVEMARRAGAGEVT